MKVKFLKLSAGPGGVIQPGTVVDVSPAEAEILWKGKYAQLLDQMPPAEDKLDSVPKPGAEPKLGRKGTGKKPQK